MMVGTTTFCATELASLFDDSGLPAGGYLECGGELRPEPDNPKDPQAIAVWAQNIRVGYLPGYLASAQDLAATGSICRVQLFARLDGTKLRVVGCVTAGGHESPYSRASWPPVTRAEAESAAAALQREQVQRRLGDPRTQEAEELGLLPNGQHYTEAARSIRELKRAGRDQDALELSLQAIDAAERANPQEPPPAYTEMAAVLYRKLGDIAGEIEVLDRYIVRLQSSGRDPQWAIERLDKAAAALERKAAKGGSHGSAVT